MWEARMCRRGQGASACGHVRALQNTQLGHLYSARAMRRVFRKRQPLRQVGAAGISSSVVLPEGTALVFTEAGCRIIEPPRSPRKTGLRKQGHLFFGAARPRAGPRALPVREPGLPGLCWFHGMQAAGASAHLRLVC